MSSKGGPRRGGYGGGGDRRGGGGQRDMTCFRCGKPGHHKNDCPNTGGAGGGQRDMTCFKCHKPGHRANDCPQSGGQQRGGGDRSYGGGRGGGGRGGGGYGDRPSTSGGGGPQPLKRPSSSGSYGATGGADRYMYLGSGGGDGGYRPPFKRSNNSAQPYSPKECKCGAKSLFVARPGVGTLGQHIDLIVNHFRLVIKDVEVYQYDIKFDCATRTLGQAVASAAPPAGAEGGGGDRESRSKVRKLRQKENRQVFNQFLDTQPQLFRSSTGHQIRPVFDGNSSFYTRWLLSNNEFTANIDIQFDGSSPMTVKVTIKFATMSDLSAINLYYDGISSDVPREALQALDIILRYGPTSDRIPIGNSLYPKWMANNPTLNRIDIDGVGNKQVVFGHYQSSRLTKMGPTILVDRSATAFFTGGPLLEFVRRLDQRARGNIDAILRQSKGLRIYTTHLTYRRSYTIKNFSEHPPHRQTFECLDANGRPKKITVKEYFKKEYNIDIKDTQFPCLIPQANKTIYLPIEVCELFPNQPVSRVKLDSFNTQQMVRTCGGQTPAERFDEIQEAVETINRVSAPYLQEFEIAIDTRPVQIPGRVLGQPTIKGLDRKVGNKMRTNVEMRSWVLVNLCERDVSDRDVDFFERELRGRASLEVGTTVEAPVKVWKYSRTQPRDIAQIFQGAQQECQRVRKTLQLIMFIIPDDTAIYSAIKHVGDCHLGIVTQCVKGKNVAKPPRGGIQSNLLLKINTKLGGVNRVLERAGSDLPKVLNKDGHRVMIIGADVTHPAPADKLETSVAACIGSIDRDYCKYTSSIRAQERTTKAQAVEMIKEFDLMIGELLAEYQKSLGQLPNHIIYYRDGVSESQFKDVMEYELDKLLKGCLKMGFTPKVTFVTVQKRHHTRMRPADPSRGTGRMRNVPPGTTADTHIVHPADFDFYLCSHEGIQGTSRPTHYYVLHDDYKFSADELQKLSYYLCHIYARTDKPISIPAPVQYAHLVAFRARNHIVAYNHSSTSRGGAGDRRDFRDESDEQRRRRENTLALRLNQEIKINSNIKNLMYFC